MMYLTTTPWRHCVAVSLFFIAVSVNAQDILWEKSYGGKHAEYLFDAIPTPDYGFILAGSSLSKKTGTKIDDNRGDLDYWVWKMDEKGELDWQRTFGGNDQDLLYAVILTNDGGFLLAGTSKSDAVLDKKDNNRGNSDFWIIKLNAKGGEEWQKTIGGNGQDEISAVIRSKDGGFIIAGSSSSEISGEKNTKGYGGMDYWVLKIDKKGEIVWQNSFGGIYNDELKGICLAKGNGYILAGSSNSPEGGTKTQKNLGLSDYWIIKIDEKGQEKWQQVIGGSGDDQLSTVLLSGDGNYILAGNSNSGSGKDKRSSNMEGTDFWVFKMESDTKEILWQETYNIGKVDVLTSIVENDDKSLLLGGYAQGEIVKSKAESKKLNNSVSDVKMKNGTDDYIVIKTNEIGEELWRKDIGSDGQDILKKVIETRDGGYLMAGTSKTINSSSGGIKATGDKSSGVGSNDFWIVKLKDKQKPKPERKPIEAIPNPATNYTNIIVGYDFTKGTATVVDLAGRVLQSFSISERTVPIDLQGLPVGIYVVNIKTDKGNDGVKVIKRGNRN
ncbi:MAG: T9SS type A sorting domain-containing protein [Flavobacterium sp. JAD_PAG50586_2]|nr:MAG: T9SS type A sorting domain-containing protein [Flavobacterium sp. JAD_PAG50586_2]